MLSTDGSHIGAALLPRMDVGHIVCRDNKSIRLGVCQNIDTVGYVTLRWGDQINNRQLLEPIGNMPPAEFETAYYRQHEGAVIMARLK